MRQFLGIDLKRTLTLGVTAGAAAIASLEVEKRVAFLADKPWVLPAAALLAGGMWHKKLGAVGDGLVGYGGFYLTLFLYSKFMSKAPVAFNIGSAAGAGAMSSGAYEAAALMSAGDMTGPAYEEAGAGWQEAGGQGWQEAGAYMGAGYLDNASALSDAFGLEA